MVATESEEDRDGDLDRAGDLDLRRAWVNIGSSFDARSRCNRASSSSAVPALENKSISILVVDDESHTRPGQPTV